MKKSRLSSVLCLLLVASMLAVSCAENKTETSETTTDAVVTEAETEAETTALSTVPVNDYDGFTYAIVVTNQDERHVDFVAEAENGDTLNDLVFKRNQRVSEAYNITITAEDNDYSQINSILQKDSTAGDCSYSLYVTNGTVYTQAAAGYCYPVYQMAGLDLSASYWDQDQQSGMSVGGNLYEIIGDICPTELLTSECLLFNKNLFDDDSMTYPYETAMEGNWTLDRLYELCIGRSKDLDGDGKMSDTADCYSLTCWSDFAQAMSYGAGIDTIVKDSDDIPSLVFDIEQMSAVYEKIYKVLIDTDANYSTNDHEQSFKVFNEGRAYFCGITFQKLEKFLRDMEDDYGVLPVPKYDEQQERYQTCVSGAGSMIAWPTSLTDVEMIGNITDAMAAASYDIITPYLYNVIIGVKNVRDEDSATIMNMIIRNRVFSIAHAYGISTDDYTQDLITKKSTDVASYIEKNRTKAEKALAKIVDSFTNIES